MGLKIPFRKECRFESDQGHHQHPCGFPANCTERLSSARSAGVPHSQIDVFRIYDASMRTVTYCFWRIPNAHKPGTHVTRYKLPRDEALKLWPTAVEAGGHEHREIPETDAEHAKRLRSMHLTPAEPWWRAKPTE